MSTLASGAATVALQSPVHGPYGRGADQVWIVRPTTHVRAVVVFGHGWKGAPPSASHPWVAQFRPWLDHLIAQGDAVIFPRYQLGGDQPGSARADAYRAASPRACGVLPLRRTRRSSRWVTRTVPRLR